MINYKTFVRFLSTQGQSNSQNNHKSKNRWQFIARKKSMQQRPKEIFTKHLCLFILMDEKKNERWDESDCWGMKKESTDSQSRKKAEDVCLWRENKMLNERKQAIIIRFLQLILWMSRVFFFLSCLIFTEDEICKMVC